MQNERFEQFADYLLKQSFVKKNLYKYTRLSGSSTEVYPIEMWRDSVELQWNSDRDCPSFIKKVVEKNKDFVSYGYFSKSDGSCPNRICFKLKKENW